MPLHKTPYTKELALKSLRKKSAPRHCVLENLESRQMMAAGDPDLSVSADVRTTVTFLGGLRATAVDAAVQRDGKTVVVGFTEGGGRQFAVARLNFDGSPDTSFDGDGLVVVPVGDIGDSRATAVAIQP